jgi:hypothetical protein
LPQNLQIQYYTRVCKGYCRERKYFRKRKNVGMGHDGSESIPKGAFIS